MSKRELLLKMVEAMMIESLQTQKELAEVKEELQLIKHQIN